MDGVGPGQSSIQQCWSPVDSGQWAVGSGQWAVEGSKAYLQTEGLHMQLYVCMYVLMEGVIMDQ